ncbi:alanine racemase [Shimia ponticola]|uniref:alanine racemase n=1 Tax=Shimia ponticola TaxID=2582893 RepID=UPI0011BF581A|nr:alanine racemase [Shimia ponticola]
MAQAHLTIDLGAICRNWQALDALSAPEVETAACVKANGYGLGAAKVGTALRDAGCKTFFVAVAEEGAALRPYVGDSVRIGVFGGHMEGDAALITAHRLIPMLNAPEQVVRHMTQAPDAPYGAQLDSGMNRLGMEADQWAASQADLNPVLVMSHLACADEPEHPMNAQQLAAFKDMINQTNAPVSLAATGGTLLDPDYHFDLTRPGIGLYGGAPFSAAEPVVRLSIPVIQTRDLQVGETVGYGNTWTADRPSKIATISAGYADGLIRAMGRDMALWSDGVRCPLVGRVSMDLITVDVTDLGHTPAMLDILCREQGVEDLAAAADTIGYEILTSLGNRYARSYV